jgi:hypothetical protein
MENHRYNSLRIFKSATILAFFFASVISINAQSYDGYTLYFPQGGNKAYLVDLSGNIYHSWSFSSNKQTCYSSYLLAGGVLLRTVNHQGNYFNGGPISGEVQTVDWNGNVLWDFVYSTQDYCSHHDIHAMPNGNILMIAYERKTAAQVVEAGCAQSIEMWPDKIVEIQPTGTSGGTVVWEWHIWDHLIQDHDATKSNYGVVANHPELLNINYNTSKDWMHMNGIDYNEELDQIVFSSHALNEIYVIDHSTTTAVAATHSGGNSGKGGDLLYRWGNPAAYQAPGTTDFNVVHDAHWVPADNPLFPNALCGYNNKGGTGVKTCVDVINPPYNGYNYSLTPGSAYEPSTYNWRHTYTGNMSQDNGNSQQLPNGNTLICIGMSGYIYEIDSNQTKVWSKSVGGTLAQSFRYPPCFVNGSYIAATSGAPSSVCAGESSQLDVAATGSVVYIYTWTSNPPGFTSNLKNPLVTPAVTTTYKVTIKNGPCLASDSITIHVNPVPPTPVITQTDDSLVSSAASGNQWYLNSVAIPGATGQVFVPNQPGSYQVRVTDTNNCLSDMSVPFLITGISHDSFNDALQVYPNPATGWVRIAGKGIENRLFTVTLFNSLEKVVMTFDNNCSLDISGLAGGIYYLTVATDRSESYRKKIILIK